MFDDGPPSREDDGDDRRRLHAQGGATIQCHSLEDASFKSDRTVLGAGVTVGAHTFVHYGVRMGDGSVLDPDAFLMKGEEPAPDTRWRGNPSLEAAELPVRGNECPDTRYGARPPGGCRGARGGRGRAGRARGAAAPRAAGESTLVDAAFAQVRGLNAPAAADLVPRVQLAGYAGLTGAFGRHADVLTGARELVVSPRR